MGLGTDGGMLLVMSARGLGSVAPEKPTSSRGHEACLETPCAICSTPRICQQLCTMDAVVAILERPIASRVSSRLAGQT